AGRSVPRFHRHPAVHCSFLRRQPAICAVLWRYHPSYHGGCGIGYAASYRELPADAEIRRSHQIRPYPGPLHHGRSGRPATINLIMGLFASGTEGKRVFYKTNDEIEMMRKANLVVSQTLGYVGSLLKPGITGAEIDKAAEEFIRDHKGRPAFKGYGQED